MAVAGGAARGVPLRQDSGVPGARRVRLPAGALRAREHPGDWCAAGGQRGRQLDGREMGGGDLGGEAGAAGNKAGTRGLGSALRTLRLPQPTAGLPSSCGCSQLPDSPHLAGRALTSCRPGRQEGGKNNLLLPLRRRAPSARLRPEGGRGRGRAAAGTGAP